MLEIYLSLLCMCLCECVPLCSCTCGGVCDLPGLTGRDWDSDLGPLEEQQGPSLLSQLCSCWLSLSFLSCHLPPCLPVSLSCCQEQRPLAVPLLCRIFFYYKARMVLLVMLGVACRTDPEAWSVWALALAGSWLSHWTFRLLRQFWSTRSQIQIQIQIKKAEPSDSLWEFDLRWLIYLLCMSTL